MFLLGERVVDDSNKKTEAINSLVLFKMKLHWVKRLTLQSTLIYLFAGMVSCSSPSLQTVAGPEDESILKNTHGYVLFNAGHDLTSMSIPDLKTKIIRNRQDSESIYAIAGPDENGSIVYVENHMMGKRHFLKTITLNDSVESIIFERTGDAIWDSVIGRDIALSHSGGKVAFVGKHRIPQISPSKWHKKAGILEYGLLEIWLIESQTSIATKIYAIDRGMAWLPDNNRLAYTALLPRNQIIHELSKQKVGGGFDEWDRVPAVMVFDLKDKTSQFLHVGWSPVVSLDGKSVVVSDLTGKHWFVDVESKHSRLIQWPGDWMGAISFVGKDLILYWGLPTTGSKQEQTIKNSPLIGPKPMGTLKVANLNTGKFKTVLSPVDPRMQVSFGMPAVVRLSSF